MIYVNELDHGICLQFRIIGFDVTQGLKGLYTKQLNYQLQSIKIFNSKSMHWPKSAFLHIHSLMEWPRG